MLGLGAPIGHVVYLRELRKTMKNEGTRYPIEQARRRDRDIIAYLFTYVLPFLGIPFTTIERAVALVLFLVLLFVIFIRTDMLCVNPVLILAGFNVYEVESPEAPPRFLTTQRDFIQSGTEIDVAYISDYLLVEV